MRVICKFAKWKYANTLQICEMEIRKYAYDLQNRNLY